MTRYNKRDMRSVDMFALFLAAAGAVMLLPSLASAASAEVSAAPVAWFSALAFLVLGLALHFKVRDLSKNGGREPEEYPGVPE